MSNKIFTEPENTTDEWADVRMTDPEEKEWDIDFVVAGGQVGYVDLRVRPALLPAFIGCLLEDISDEQASTILTDVADRKRIEIHGGTDDETGDE